MDFLKEAIAIEPEIIKIRREIHQKPELAYREQTTAKLVAEQLKALGIQVKQGIGGAGILGILKSPKTRRVVALRADMEALPLDETAQVEFKPTIKGVMHPSGHDTHLPMLLGAAQLRAN